MMSDSKVLFRLCICGIYILCCLIHSEKMLFSIENNFRWDQYFHFLQSGRKQLLLGLTLLCELMHLFLLHLWLHHWVNADWIEINISTSPLCCSQYQKIQMSMASFGLIKKGVPMCYCKLDLWKRGWAVTDHPKELGLLKLEQEISENVTDDPKESSDIFHSGIL